MRRKSDHERVIERVNRKIDPRVLAFVADPGPDERAVLLLGSLIEYEKSPDYCTVSWASQEEAAAFYNANGLIPTLTRLSAAGMLE